MESKLGHEIMKVTLLIKCLVLDRNFRIFNIFDDDGFYRAKKENDPNKARGENFGMIRSFSVVSVFKSQLRFSLY